MNAVVNTKAVQLRRGEKAKRKSRVTKVAAEEKKTTTGAPKKESRAALRWRELQTAGPTGVMGWLTRRPKRREPLDFVESDLWITLARVARDEDIERLLTCYIDPNEDFADVVFRLPGFVLAAHIGSDAALGYLQMLVFQIWNQNESHTPRHKLATWLFKEFRRRHKLPLQWAEGGWWDLS